MFSFLSTVSGPFCYYLFLIWLSLPIFKCRSAGNTFSWFLWECLYFLFISSIFAEYNLWSIVLFSTWKMLSFPFDLLGFKWEICCHLNCFSPLDYFCFTAFKSFYLSLVFSTFLTVWLDVSFFELILFVVQSFLKYVGICVYEI